MEHYSSQNRSGRILHSGKKPTGDRRSAQRTERRSAAAAAERTLGHSFPGVPGEYLLSAGNQFLLRAAERANQAVRTPELRFSESSPVNSFDPGEVADFQIPGFTGNLVGITSLDGIPGGL